VQYQTTLRDAIEFTGVGLHTGAASRVRVTPAAADTGLCFALEGGVEIPARAEFVVDTRRATVLGRGETRVSTVEHLLSALSGMGVTNARIAVDGPEIPVADGSAGSFADGIAAVGLSVQREPRRRYIPTEARAFRDGDKLLIVLPAPSFRVRMTIDFPAPIGVQYRELEVTPETYRSEIAPNRTFAYKHEVETLLAHGLALGGTLDNAVVFDSDGPMSPLRAADEPVRHKMLDLIGDFALLGAYPQCEIVAFKSGHKLHCSAVRELSNRSDDAIRAASAG
jgi:UDP-3-O-[3-hydroxymyristoyl] N-acetylglucosamine deacetylase